MSNIGTRLRELREGKKLSQGHIEKRSGLLRCYLSRCENGHTVPSIDTLEKWTRALGVPLYQLFYTGNGSPNFIEGKKAEKLMPKDKKFLEQFVQVLPGVSERDRKLILNQARQMSAR